MIPALYNLLRSHLRKLAILDPYELICSRFGFLNGSFCLPVVSIHSSVPLRVASQSASHSPPRFLSLLRRIGVMSYPWTLFDPANISAGEFIFTIRIWELLFTLVNTFCFCVLSFALWKTTVSSYTFDSQSDATLRNRDLKI